MHMCKPNNYLLSLSQVILVLSIYLQYKFLQSLELQSWTKIVGTLVHNYFVKYIYLISIFPLPLSMLCCCEREEQTASHMMPYYNIDLGEQGVSSFPALMAKIVGSKSKSVPPQIFNKWQILNFKNV